MNINLNSKHELAIIMPAKNVESFIEDSINSCLQSNRDDVILVIIDDHSTDTTYEVVKRLSKLKKNLILKRNPGVGKVQAINFGYSLIEANYYKFVDSDDILKKNFWNLFFSEKRPKISFIHSLRLVDESLNPIRDWHMPDLQVEMYRRNIEDIKLLPKAAWTFVAKDTDAMFPMPNDMPYEDIWFSFIIYIKKAHILNIKVNMYDYRQHNSQTFGNISDNSEKLINFRFKRIADALNIFLKSKEFLNYQKELNKAILITDYMLHNIKFYQFFKNVRTKTAIKHLMLLRFTNFYEFLQKILWISR